MTATNTNKNKIKRKLHRVVTAYRAEHIDNEVARLLRKYGYPKTVAGITEKYQKEQRDNYAKYLGLMAAVRRIYDQMRSGHPPPINET